MFFMFSHACPPSACTIASSTAFACFGVLGARVLRRLCPRRMRPRQNRHRQPHRPKLSASEYLFQLYALSCNPNPIHCLY